MMARPYPVPPQSSLRSACHRRPSTPAMRVGGQRRPIIRERPIFRLAPRTLFFRDPEDNVIEIYAEY